MTSTTNKRLSAGLRTASISLGLLIAGCLLLTALFWNANFYEARDRWEHFKLASFGEWYPAGWCPPGMSHALCPKADDGIEEEHLVIDHIRRVEAGGLQESFVVTCTREGDAQSQSRCQVNPLDVSQNHKGNNDVL